MAARRKKRDDGFRLEDVLAVLRSLEETDDALVVLGDEAAMKVLVAWSHTDQAWVRPEGKQPLPIHGRLGQLWMWITAGWDLDVRRIAQLAGIPSMVVHEKIMMLVGNRLVYPDG